MISVELGGVFINGGLMHSFTQQKIVWTKECWPRPMFEHKNNFVGEPNVLGSITAMVVVKRLDADAQLGTDCVARNSLISREPAVQICLVSAH